MSTPHFIIAVDGMMCQKNCGSTVEKAIKSVQGVEEVRIAIRVKQYQDFIDLICFLLGNCKLQRQRSEGVGA